MFDVNSMKSYKYFIETELLDSSISKRQAAVVYIGEINYLGYILYYYIYIILFYIIITSGNSQGIAWNAGSERSKQPLSALLYED